MNVGYNIEASLAFIVLLPFAGALINGLVGRHASKTAVACTGIGTIAASLVLAIAAWVHLGSLPAGADRKLILDAFEWFTLDLGANAGMTSVRVQLVMDALSAVFALIITGIGLCIHVFSVGYMWEDPGFSRFFSYLNLFTGFMLLLVLGGSFPVLFVGWEGVGLVSYLLIGFWWQDRTFALAGQKAFVVNRIGDLGVILGMLVLLHTVGSLDFATINSRATMVTVPFELGGLALTASVGTVAGLLIFFGCTGKSAQFPLHVWLADAMAGPTPVSALIHAATMVTAGVYLVCRLAPVFALAPMALMVIATVGTITALGAALIASVQTRLKKALAYSTISQLGFMFAAAGATAFGAAVFHVFTHAFFKAVLFLAAGSVMHAVGEHADADVAQLGGLKQKLPWTHAAWLAGTCGLAGVPFFSGFFSKDDILVGVSGAALRYPMPPWLNWALYIGLALTAILTAFYAFRIYFLTFTGSYRGAAHPHEAPLSMRGPLAVLGVGAVLAGYLGLPHLFHLPHVLGDWLAPVLSVSSWDEPNKLAAAEVAHGWSALVTGILATSIGAVGAWWWSPKEAQGAVLLGSWQGARRLFLDALRIDAVYQVLVVSPLKTLGWVVAGVDRAFVTPLTVRLPALSLTLAGFFTSRLQSPLVHLNAALMVAGCVALCVWGALPHARVDVQADGHQATLLATPGFGTELRWDVDSDGKWDSDWSSKLSAEHAYSDTRRHDLVLVLRTTSLGLHEEVVRLAIGAHKALAYNQDALTPAMLIRRKDGLYLRPNGVLTSLVNQDLPEVRLEPGMKFQLGSASAEVASVVVGVVDARSAFGLTRRIPFEVVLKAKPKLSAISIP